MKRQKKYETEESIIKDIDAANRKIARLKSSADGLQICATLHKASGNNTAGDSLMDEADELFKKAERIQNTRLKMLQHTLAAFKTEPMFGERRVVLQNV